MITHDSRAGNDRALEATATDVSSLKAIRTIAYQKLFQLRLVEFDLVCAALAFVVTLEFVVEHLYTADKRTPTFCRTRFDGQTSSTVQI